MAASEPIRESRAERKRRETRQRLIDAAEQLMLEAEGPIDEVQIKHITEAADVGHGTFYVHFKTKHEILVPIVQARAARWDELIQAKVRDLSDPAEVVSYSGRQMSRFIQRDPLWRWFLQNSGVPVREIQSAIGRFTARDLNRALSRDRFSVPDIRVAGSFLFGAYVSALLASFEADDPDQVIDQTMELVLRVLGIDDDEACQLAHRPLDPIGADELETTSNRQQTRHP
jgi:AcrR family transcriptional regulator